MITLLHDSYETASDLMERKPVVMICDDSERERMRFYARQFDNVEIYGVRKVRNKFVEDVTLDSPQALYREIVKLRKGGSLPDLVLLDLFYKRDIPDVDRLEHEAIANIISLKDQFRVLSVCPETY